jgi:hypothetical protein
VLAIAAWLRADEKQSRRNQERATRNAEAGESAAGG